MGIITQIFGEGKDLDTLQMTARAIVTFFIALLFIRIAGRRSFGSRTAFDNIISLLLGAVLSRVVVGASPFIPTVTACTAIVLLHRTMAWLSIFSDTLGHIMKGERMLIFDKGHTVKHNMRKGLISERDLEESIRMEMHSESTEKIDKIYLERNGEVSILKS